MIEIAFIGGPLDGGIQQLTDGPGDSITLSLLIPRPAGGSDRQQIGTYQRVRPGLTYVWPPGGDRP